MYYLIWHYWTWQQAAREILNIHTSYLVTEELVILVFCRFWLAPWVYNTHLINGLESLLMPKQKTLDFFVPFKVINCFLMNLNYRSMWVNVHEIVEHVLQPYKFRWTSAVRLQVHIPKINTRYPNNSKCKWPSFVCWLQCWYIPSRGWYNSSAN